MSSTAQLGGSLAPSRAWVPGATDCPPLKLHHAVHKVQAAAELTGGKAGYLVRATGSLKPKKEIGLSAPTGSLILFSLSTPRHTFIQIFFPFLFVI